jgi:hypothetical protein
LALLATKDSKKANRILDDIKDFTDYVVPDLTTDKDIVAAKNESSKLKRLLLGL